MNERLKTLLSAIAVVTVISGGVAQVAYADAPQQEESGGMMQGGMMGQGGMMNMMGQMNQMMETCNKMMQGMAQNHDNKDQKEEITPEKKG